MNFVMRDNRFMIDIIFYCSFVKDLKYFIKESIF